VTARKQPGTAFWATVAVALALVAYPLSFGPAVWLTARRYFRPSTVQSVYWPVLWPAAHVPALEKAVVWWGSLGVPSGKWVYLEIETDEALVVFEFPDSSESTESADDTPDPDGVL
jgi:hypothetical protein